VVDYDALSKKSKIPDPEILYKKKNESVEKRRQQLIKRKHDESMVKIQAKYQKIEELRKSRNGFKDAHTNSY